MAFIRKLIKKILLQRQTLRVRIHQLFRPGDAPLNNEWGFNRGKPIDRYYIEEFIKLNREYIFGDVLSIGDDYYAQKYKKADINSDILHVHETETATIVADLTDAQVIADNKFDCFLFIQTLQLIYDVRSAIKTSYRILKPGGIMLATFPGITPLKDEEWNDSWYWNFTYQSAKCLFSEFFPESHLSITVNGNACTAIAFLDGLAIRDLPKKVIGTHDSRFPVLIAVKAKKPE